MKKRQLSLLIREILNNPLNNRVITIVNHSDPGLIGLSGVVLKESKNIIFIKTNHKTLMVEKKSGEFLFKINKLNIKIHGSLLVNLPKYRKKRKLNRW